MPAATLKAVNELTLDIAGRRVPGAGRPFGLRQVDGAAHDRRARGNHRRRRLDRRRSSSTTSHPKDRDIAMVFQNYALYPHMIGLRQHRLPAADRASCRKAEIREARAWRRPASSSSKLTSSAGPASSRAASASASPWAAPSCASRPSTSWTSRSPTSMPSCACRCAPRSRSSSIGSGTTTIYVTHDQVEAMTMGHRVALLKDGVLQQVDTPSDIYDQAAQHVRRRLHRRADDEPLFRHPGLRDGRRRQP